MHRWRCPDSYDRTTTHFAAAATTTENENLSENFIQFVTFSSSSSLLAGSHTHTTSSCVCDTERPCTYFRDERAAAARTRRESLIFFHTAARTHAPTTKTIARPPPPPPPIARQSAARSPERTCGTFSPRLLEIHPPATTTPPSPSSPQARNRQQHGQPRRTDDHRHIRWFGLRAPTAHCCSLPYQVRIPHTHTKQCGGRLSACLRECAAYLYCRKERFHVAATTDKTAQTARDRLCANVCASITGIMRCKIPNW